jgi:hypothetical protein
MGRPLRKNIGRDERNVSGPRGIFDPVHEI